MTETGTGSTDDEAPTAARSALMARVKGKNTKPELIVRRALHALGARFRLHRRDLPGRPDIVLPSRRLAVFVHGCFWHRHPGCRLASMPKTRQAFWADKFAANVARDDRNLRDLARSGWNTAVIWECETRDAAELYGRLRQLLHHHPRSGRPAGSIEDQERAAPLQ